MSKRISLHFLHDINQAIDAIARFTDGMSQQEFARDDKTIRAVERELEIIGEAVKKLPSEITSEYSDIPWKLIARMRDRLIHHYWDTEVDILWRTIKESLPPLKQTILKIVEQHAEDTDK